MTAPTMTVQGSGVKIRMYRQGMGDCFLLAFPTRNGRRPCYMLIDCGVLDGTPDARGRMKKIAESLRQATGGRIDVLVVTHQHWDNLSGFELAREVFDKLEIGQVWTSWTEDPEDPLARELRERRTATLRGLHAAAGGLRLRGATERAGALDSLLGLYGEWNGGGGAATERVFRYVLGRAGQPRFCVPGEAPLALPGVAAARVFVLGPPRDEELLTRSSPSRADAYGESRLALDEESAFQAAALSAAAEVLSADDTELRDLSLPFDRMYRVPMAAAQRDCFFQEHYFNDDCDWRRIDGDWLAYACDLALRLDSDTNNTSLALAIELVPSGKVLLFPADAQAGSWISWHDHLWEDGDDPDCAALTAADLLRRTVVYKVGHHASHNATPREGGLELMESPELVALIPVDEAAARSPRDGCPHGWNMPFPPLLARLVQKTRGRVLRADAGLPEKPPYVSARDWQAFEDCCAASRDGLYIELTVSNPDPGRRRSS